MSNTSTATKGSVKPIEVTTNNGDVIRLRPHTSKGGNVYWGITRPNTGKFAGQYGVMVPSEAFGGELPEYVTIAGKRVDLKLGKTDKGKRTVKGGTMLTIDGHGKKQFNLRLTEVSEGVFNIAGSVNGVSGNGGGVKATVALADL